jgi:hypothetical protein
LGIEEELGETIYGLDVVAHRIQRGRREAKKVPTPSEIYFRKESSFSGENEIPAK